MEEVGEGGGLIYSINHILIIKVFHYNNFIC